MYHVCALSKKFSFLCPNGTVFDQKVFVCNWWYNVDCASSPNYYNLNDQIGVSRPSQQQQLQQQALVSAAVGGSNPFFGQQQLIDKPPRPSYGLPQPPPPSLPILQPVLSEPIPSPPFVGSQQQHPPLTSSGVVQAPGSSAY